MGWHGEQSPPEAKVAAVTKRAQERWDLLLKGDVKAAYAYLSPASTGSHVARAVPDEDEPGEFSRR